MKTTLFISITIILFFASCKKSETLKIISSTKNEKNFSYTPNNEISITDSTYVLGITKSGEYSSYLKKEGNHYIFSLPIPDSIQAITFAFFDKDSLIDQNKSFGYWLFSNNLPEIEKEREKISLLNKSDFFFKLNLESEAKVLYYDSIFHKFPELKNDENIAMDYIIEKNFYNKLDTTEFNNLIDKLSKNGDYESYKNLSILYFSHKDLKKNDSINKLIVSKFPKSDDATYSYFNELIQNNKKPYQIYELFKEREKIIGKNSTELEDFVLATLLFKFIKSKDIDSITKYENEIIDKNTLTGSYNNTAWEMAGGGLNGEAHDLDIALYLSKKATEFSKKNWENSPIHLKNRNVLDYLGNADTYALVLYKLGKFEEAFNVQYNIFKIQQLGVDGIERLAVYAEKVKGENFVKDLIENQIKKDISSPILIQQLKNIYKKLNIPDTQYKKILEIANKKNNEEIEKSMGTLTAFDFQLKTLKGDSINLSDMKGKIVILDFWATWCGPCKASMPDMQNIVNQYKNKDVVFLFIDTFEHDKDENITFNNVKQFISENHYSFNVLFDTGSIVSNQYKIKYIPSRIIIGKDGKFAYLGATEDTIKEYLESNL